MYKYTSIDDCNDFLLSLNLIKCRDIKKYIKTIYAIGNNVESNYRVYKIKKKSHGYRTIYAPNKNLKYIQRQILNNILNNKSISKYATAYHKGISLRDNAIPHINKDIVLKLDIKNFFESISFGDVYNACFAMDSFPKSVGMLLTYLCTYSDHLTQGSPTSSYISNLVMKEFDEELGSWCEENDISYTRYSDDMTFSGYFNPSEVIIKVKKMLHKLSLELNDKKVHVVYKSARQDVTGITVNEKVQVNIKYRKDIRKEIYYIRKFGLSSHLERRNIKSNKDKYLDTLYGKILYVLQINSNDKEFIEYKDYIGQLKKTI
mgnify:FL=1